MLGGNAPVTIWNRQGNGYYRTEIRTLCRCKLKTDRVVAGAGANIISSLVFVIPLLENYLPPLEWLGLEDKAGRFTVRVEDCIAAGLHPYEIGKDGLTVPRLREMLAGQFAEVKAVSYNIYAHLGKHVRAEGI